MTIKATLLTYRSILPMPTDMAIQLTFTLIDGQPRLSKLSQIHHIRQPAEILSEYHYSTDGELTAVYHKGQLVREFAYTQHLMTWQRYLTGLEATLPPNQGYVGHHHCCHRST